MNDVKKNLDYLVRPKSIAFVGASPNNFFGNMMLENLSNSNFEGVIYPINPKYEELKGMKCYPNLQALPEPVDCVIIMVRRELVQPTFNTAIELGCRSAVIISAGFSESGEPEWKAVQEEMKKKALENDFPVLGPNCLGFINAIQDIPAMTAPIRGGILKGNIGMVFQSGAFMQAATMPFYQRNLGITFNISTGNSMVLETSDFIEYFVDDPNTDVIVTFIEGIRDPQKFIRVAKKALKAEKPIIVLKTGASERGQRSTMAHTGSMAGADRVADEIFKKYGITRVYDFNELVETAALFCREVKLPKPESDGMCILCASGGAVGLYSDIAQSLGIQIPELLPETQEKLKSVLPPSCFVANPIDTTAQVLNNLSVYREAVNIINEDPQIGILVAFETVGLPSNDTPSHQTRLLNVTRAAKEDGLNLVMSSLANHALDDWHKEFLTNECHYPFVQTATQTLKCVTAYLKYCKFLREKRDAVLADVPAVDTTTERYTKGVELLKKCSGRALTEHESKELFTLYDIPVTQEKTAADADAAVAAAEAIGYPVVIKVDSPDILHKTEVKGIKVGVKNAEEVRAAFDEIMANAKAARPDANILGVLVQEMVSGGEETIVGAKIDPQFGPVVLFGLGGIFVEIMKDTQLRVAPLSKDDALDMIKNVKAFPIFNGARGRNKRDVDAMADALVNVSRMVYELKDYISELDVNPMLMKDAGEGVKALDALVVAK